MRKIKIILLFIFIVSLFFSFSNAYATTNFNVPRKAMKIYDKLDLNSIVQSDNNSYTFTTSNPDVVSITENVAIANKFWEGNEAALNQISQISTYKQFKSAVENQTNGYVDLTSDENKDARPQVGDAVYMDDPNGGNFHEGVVVGYTDDGKAIVAEANSANSEIKGGSVFRVYDFNSDSEKSIKGFFPIGERTQTQQTTEETTEESTEQTSDEVQEESDDSKKKPLNKP